MDAPPCTTTSDSDWAATFSQARSRHHERAEQFVAAQRERLARFAAGLEEQIEKIGGQVAEDRAAVGRGREELDGRSAEIQQQAERLQQLREELAARRNEVEELQQQGTERQSALTEQIRQQQAEAEQAAALRARLEEKVEQLESQCQELREKVEQLEPDLETARAESQRLQEQLESGGGDSEELEQLYSDRNNVVQRLEETEHQLEQTRGQLTEAERQLAEGGASDAEAADFKRRYEMAMDDLRELRARNAELERKAAQSGGRGPVWDGGGELDWEAQKQKFLAALEAEAHEDDGDEEATERRLEIEDVVRKTDAAIAEKQREIEELRELLENQSHNVGSLAVGAAALGEVLDQDDIIREQRANLEELQGQWREKLRQAEVEISIERAKIARERAELEEKLEALQQAQENGPHPGAEPGKPQKPARGRWLAQLGLKRNDDE